MGGLEWLGVTQGHRQCHIRYSAYDFLFIFNRNYVTVPFSRYSKIFVKIYQLLPIPLAFRGDPIQISPRAIRCKKTRAPGQLCDIVYVISGVAGWRVMDVKKDT